jgi:hypothetical protein
MEENRSPIPEQEPPFIQSFDELAALGSEVFDGGTQVTFQPHGRYEEGRQTGKVRIWKDSPDVISITFMGSKVGVAYPDSERITRENFEARKDTWKIRKVEQS